MNSFQLNIKDQAEAEAKRFDSTVVGQIHVAIAAAVITGSELADSLRELARKSLGSQSAAAGITADAQALLDRFTDPATTSSLLPQISKELGLAVEVGSANEPIKNLTATNSTATTTPPEENLTVDEVLAELDELVGLTEVKEQLHKFLAMHQANAVREKDGKQKIPLSLHLVFTGNPGTGKTTVARIVGKLYRAANILPKGHLVETDRSGLVAGYVGQTALKVQELINQADGGILFIDEAYSLAGEAAEDFGREAIAALVKGMEDRRESLAVIAAGYSDQMKNFIEINPGLRSRFQTFVNFPNYSVGELTEIFKRMSDHHDIDASKVMEHVSAHIGSAYNSISSGNGRFVRNLFEKMYANLALRAAADGVIEPSEVAAFDPADIPALEGEDGKPRLGFR